MDCADPRGAATQIGFYHFDLAGAFVDTADAIEELGRDPIRIG